MNGTGRRARVSGLVAISVVGLLSVTASPDPAGAGSPCGTPVDVNIVNGGFEEPTLEEGSGSTTRPRAGRRLGGYAEQWGPAPEFGSQYIQIIDGSVSQQLDGTALAGSTVTLQITWFGAGSVGLGSATQSIDSNNAVVATATVSFDVPDDAPAALPLTLGPAPASGSTSTKSAPPPSPNVPRRRPPSPPPRPRRPRRRPPPPPNQRPRRRNRRPRARVDDLGATTSTASTAPTTAAPTTEPATTADRDDATHVGRNDAGAEHHGRSGAAAGVALGTVTQGQVQTGTGTGFQPGETVAGEQRVDPA